MWFNKWQINIIEIILEINVKSVMYCEYTWVLLCVLVAYWFCTQGPLLLQNVLEGKYIKIGTWLLEKYSIVIILPFNK